MKKLLSFLAILSIMLIATSCIIGGGESSTTPSQTTKEKTVTVEFILNGELNTTYTISKGSTAPQAPELDVPAGYEERGWFSDEAGTIEFDFNSKIEEDTKIYGFIDPIPNPFAVEAFAYNEGICAIWNNKTDSEYTLEYLNLDEDGADWNSVDPHLIRTISNDGATRADIVGLKAGKYDIRLTHGGDIAYVRGLEVQAHDRSGYAHFNHTEGVGGYNDDGTLKENALVVYVSEETKNTVEAVIAGKTYTGISAILGAQRLSDRPLVVRIIGTIGAATWNPIDYNGNPVRAGGVLDKDGNVVKSSLKEDQIIAKGVNTLDTSKYSKLNGLRNQLKWDGTEYDSVWNTLECKFASNITVEGIGNDAGIDGFGITFESCINIEVRNLSFSNYGEDGLGFICDSDKLLTHGHYWIHHNTFNKGYNPWDLTAEQDKHNGDGSTDFSQNCAHVTIAYNKYNNTHKTCLISGNDSAKNWNFTIHHNFYNQCSSRLPMARGTNIHLYNNYYYNCSNAVNARKYCFFFSEGNYFEGVNTTHNAQSSNIIKSFGDVFDSCNGTNNSTKVTDRAKKLGSVNCKPDGSTNYSNFDTNSTLFYYDAENNVSLVEYLTSAEQAKADCIANSGTLK